MFITYNKETEYNGKRIFIPLTLHLDIVGTTIALRCGGNIPLSKRTKSRSVDRVGGSTSNGGKSDSGGKLHG